MTNNTDAEHILSSSDDRDALVAAVAAAFPAAAARGTITSPIRGGAAAAATALAAVDPAAYRRSRGHLGGSVTQLSPYLRHGLLYLAEARDRALGAALKTGEAWKLVNQLSWRDYFNRVYMVLGDAIWQDMEPYKTGLRHDAYAPDMPADVVAAQTGAVCIDTWSQTLQTTGYLHNHVRLYLAAYLVHWRRVRWQAGARWFLAHLLDGDPPANNLSWQWVSSTWRYGPYLWNRANLIKNGGGELCARCPLYDAGCPFAKSYAHLTAELFPSRKPHPDDAEHGIDRSVLKGVDAPLLPTPTRMEENTVVVWVHGDGMRRDGPALAAYAGAPAVWVWDEALIAEYSLDLKRLVFLQESLHDLPVTLRRGAVVAEVVRFAAEQRATVIATTPSPSPRFRAICTELAQHFELQIWPEPAYVVPPGPLNLLSHTTYWHQIKHLALQPTAKEA